MSTVNGKAEALNKADEFLYAMLKVNDEELLRKVQRTKKGEVDLAALYAHCLNARHQIAFKIMTGEMKV